MRVGDRGTGNGEGKNWTRRGFVAAGAGGLAGLALPVRSPFPVPRSPLPGRLKQSVSRWTYGSMPLRDLCREARAIGLVAIDLLNREDWPVVREFGLTCSMGYARDRRGFIANGFNDPANHAMLLNELEEAIPLAAQAGVPNLIAMFGNRGGRSDEESIANCVAGLSRIKALAEQHGVTICVELLNSKVDHRDYQGDRTAFGVAVVRAVGSPRVKLLYDIYHMQIMEGDVIRTIRDNKDWIAHYHTGGVPGRHEINAGQELNYRAVALAIAETGFTGYVAHEFMPAATDKLASLREAFAICDV